MSKKPGRLIMVILVRCFSNLLWNKHGRLPLLLFTVLAISSIARSQTDTTLAGSFDKEMADYGASRTDSILLPAMLSPLPQWLFAPLPIKEDTLFIFGISDPGLADTIAYKQAVLRAMAFGALAEGTACEHFSDFYSQEGCSGADSKYEEIYRFSAGISEKTTAPSILRQTILPGSEAIVLMGSPVKNLMTELVKNTRIEAFLYNNEADLVYGNNISGKIDVSIQKRDSDNMFVLDASTFYQINGKATGVRCSFPQSQSAYNRFEFYYTTADSVQHSDSSRVHGTTCKQGLWIAYITQILGQLSWQTKMLNMESQVVKDKTGNKSTELVRERSRTRLSWRINGIDVYENKMRVSMTILTF